MTKVIIAIIADGAALSLIVGTLVCMFWRWAIPGKKEVEETLFDKEALFKRDMETYKKLEYWNQLNDN